jgi:hypothetical protein
MFHPSGAFELHVRRKCLRGRSDGTVIIDTIGPTWLGRRKLDAIALGSEAVFGL